MEAQAGSEVTRVPSTGGPEESSGRSSPHGGSAPGHEVRSEEAEPTHTPALAPSESPDIPLDEGREIEDLERDHPESRLESPQEHARGP
eukprot:5032934-Pyramimonas_sp.AAC.1